MISFSFCVNVGDLVDCNLKLLFSEISSASSVYLVVCAQSVFNMLTMLVLNLILTLICFYLQIWDVFIYFN